MGWYIILRFWKIVNFISTRLNVKPKLFPGFLVYLIQKAEDQPDAMEEIFVPLTVDVR